jgi:tetratricopeptide (TPR) repeat protein
MNNQRGFALLNNYFGDYYKNEKDYDLAAQYYTTALNLYEGMQNKFGASLALYNLGLLHLELKKCDEAIALATKSLNYAKAIGILDQTYHSEKLLSDLYAIKNDSQLSFFHYKNYIVARDSIVNQENTKKILDSLGANKTKTVLITSAFHIPRAEATFKSAGVNVRPYPCAFSILPSSVKFSAESLLPSTSAMDGWAGLFKELIGLAVIKMKG